MKKLVLIALTLAASLLAQQQQACSPFRQTDCVLNGVYIPPPPPPAPPAPPLPPAQCDPAKTRQYDQPDASTGQYPQYGQALLPLNVTGAPPAYTPPYWPPNYWDAGQILANYQTWVDWSGWATEFWPASRSLVLSGYPVPAYTLQHVANVWGQSYCFQGVTYNPQPLPKGN